MEFLIKIKKILIQMLLTDYIFNRMSIINIW